MNDTPINRKTLEKINTPILEGTRHTTAIGIAADLLANGMSPAAVFEVLRSKFSPGLPDDELRGIIQWAEKKRLSPTPHGPAWKPQAPTPRVKTPAEYAAWWLSNRTITEADFVEASQLKVPSQPVEQARLVLEMLYEGAEHLDIVCDYLERDGKACPKGAGKILTRDAWIDWLNRKGVPQSKAGAWLRPNPCKEKGSGAVGAVTDSDVVAHRFLLLESDVLPLETQLALFSKFKLPIALVMLSGGQSAHAWVRLDAANVTEFSERARRLLAALAPFGIDQANKNPSRLSRLPGAKRMIAARGDGAQKLLWLNPAVKALTDEQLECFEDSLEIPAIEEKPFQKIVHDALARYQDMFDRKGQLGIPTGIADFDRDAGGLKAGQMTVISGESGQGKSSLALNIANAALRSRKAVALFTLEMSNDDIADLMFAMNCRIERDKFNTGKFEQKDIDKMMSQSVEMAKVPFWSCDDSLLTVEQIRKRTLQLKREFNVELVIVDYAQIVSPSSRQVQREQQVAEIARGLCSMAKEAAVALVVLSQLNDEGKLRESRVIGHEAHNVVNLENKENQGHLIFHIVKGRRIRKKSYVLHYEPEYCLIASESKTNEQGKVWYERD
jgi:KaiC/GvpD/RAD55 family RecA-like ATPase